MALIMDACETYFRNEVLTRHNNPEFFSRWLDNLRDLETQLLVSPEGGFPVEGKRNVWTDGSEEWHNIRYPKNAMAEPYWRDRELSFLLEKHWLGIGTTWWNWVKRESVGCGFDFDDVTSHAPGTGVSDEQLNEVMARACELDYVEVLRSTGGKGLHLYIFFDENNRPKTANHSEHAAIARAMLGKLSTDADFNFGSHLDVCGGNLWVAHTKMFGLADSFQSVKKATAALSADDIPPNWRDHLAVISGKSTKVRVVGVDDTGGEIDDQDPLSELTSSHPKVALDDTHKKIIADLEMTGVTCVWVPDHNLLQTHTAGLLAVYNQWADEGHSMRGFFNTVSPGTDTGKPNCFCIPKRDGAFLVFRFGQGTLEHSLWNQDRQAWTWANYNRQPNLAEASIALGGAELENNKGFRFEAVDGAKATVAALGSKLELPACNNYSERAATLRKNKDGRLVVEIERRESDAGFEGWDGQKRSKWIKVFNVMIDNQNEEDDYTRFDTIVRSCRSPSDADAGWRVRVKSGPWIKHPRENVSSVLSTVAPPNMPLAKVMGSAILNQWLLVCKPFHEEFPGGRQWNLGAPQLVYQPAQLDDEQPSHPHWDKVMTHCGEDLDGVVRETSWCKNWGIFNGRDYLTAWVSCLLREPFEPLPYLFMYGPQNSGKSIFHEAVSLLVTGGVVKADRALTNSSDFNGELANAVLGVIDEVNISNAGPGVYNKIKEWTTSQFISIHAKYQQVYQQRNCLHFVQTANYRDSCPIFPGDTRITAMYVGPLLEEIPKPTLIRALVEEAPHFMATLMGLSLPTSDTRLRLPILDTAGKEQAAESNKNPLDEFVEEVVHHCPGQKTLFKDFFTKFSESLSAFELANWGKRRVRQNIPDIFPVGVGPGGQLYIGNMSFTAVEVPPGTPRYVSQGRLIRLEE